MSFQTSSINHGQHHAAICKAIHRPLRHEHFVTSFIFLTFHTIGRHCTVKRLTIIIFTKTSSSVTYVALVLEYTYQLLHKYDSSARYCDKPYKL